MFTYISISTHDLLVLYTLFTSNDVNKDYAHPQDTMQLWSSDFAQMAIIHMNV
jgi:hypothetical protein